MTSSRTVDMVIFAVALIAFFGLAAVVWLVHGKTPADQTAVVVALVGPAIGSLTSMLVSTRSVTPAPTPEEAADAGPG